MKLEENMECKKCGNDLKGVHLSTGRIRHRFADVWYCEECERFYLVEDNKQKRV